MRDGWMTTAALLARTRIRGKRPDASLKRLRREGILAHPVRGGGRGRARGVTWWYPPGSDERVNRVVVLRDRGLRAFRDLRWQLWFEGAADVWDRLQVDLLDAYPKGVLSELERLAKLDEDSVADAIASEAEHLGGRWSGRPMPRADASPRVSREDQETLAYVAIGAAVPGHEVALDARLDEVTGGRTIGHAVDSAWGSRSAELHDELVQSGATDAKGWEEALQRASASQAVQAAALLRRTVDPKLLRRDLRQFGDEWGDRALLVAGLLHSIRSLGRIEQT